MSTSSSAPVKVSTYGNEKIYGREPLIARHIRLFQLDRDASSQTALVGTLSVVPLDGQIVYSALSYCWGDPTPTHNITINGSPFGVTENLFTFLAIKQESSGSLGMLWIDAICIDQSNVPEREQQVKIMGDVYRCAAAVEVWLGAAADGSDGAFELIRALTPMLHSDSFTLDQLYDEPATDPNSSAWPSLAKLMYRPWFRRVWVIQEVGLAASVVVQCGKEMITWEDLAAVVKGVLHHTFWDFEEYKPEDRPGYGWHMVMNILEAPNFRLCEQDIGVTYSLLMFRDSLATDPRDKIYGCLGLCGSDGELQIEPNYSVPVEELYTDATRMILLKADSLEMLAIAGIGYGRSTPGLPSWVSDYAYTTRQNWELRFWNPAPDTLPHISSPHAKRISLAGLIVDIVADLGPILERSATEEPRWRWYQKVEKQFLKPGVNDEMFWRTLCADRESPESEVTASASYATSFEAYRLFWPKYFEPVSDVQDDAAYSSEQYHKATSYHVMQNFAMRGRRVCSTRKNRLGIVVPGSRTGDVIFVAYGSRVLLLIRPVPNDVNGALEYELVGPCYLQGMMEGEALNMGLEEEHIVLI